MTYAYVMTYSLDLRQQVVAYVEQGGSKAEAARHFKVSPWCVGDWCKRDDLASKPSSPQRKRKLDWESLKKHVQDYPDTLLRERAEHFSVTIRAIEYAMKEMKITRKKHDFIEKGIMKNG
jgi:transposase